MQAVPVTLRIRLILGGWMTMIACACVTGLSALIIFSYLYRPPWTPLPNRGTAEITKVEEDYKKCGEVPPPPPSWTEAVTAIVKVKSEGNEMVQRILEEIKRSVQTIHDKAIAEYRRAYESRHKILNGFMPFWRSLDKTFGQVDKKLTGLQDTSSKIDAQMEKYEQINKKTDKAEHQLTVSAFTQFAIATLVLLIAAGGTFVNFWLIARPMSEMVGGNVYVGPMRVSEIAALVIILVEAKIGRAHV